MDIRKVNNPKSEWENVMEGRLAADVASVVFNINKKKVKIKKAKIKDIAKGLAEIAYSMGETNDEEGFAELMTEDIMAGIALASQRQDKKKKSKF